MKRCLSALLLLLLLPQIAWALDFEDAFSRPVSIESPKRVVSLYGSYAENWLLAGGELVGVTEDAVGERGLALGADVQIVGTVKAPNLEMILRQNPDFVLLSADIEPQAAVELQRAAARRRFGVAEHHADLLADLVDEDDDAP